MSLIDTAIDRGQPLPSSYSVEKLREIRAAIEYAIFAVLEFKLRGSFPQLHSRLLSQLFPVNVKPQVISLNCDIIGDKTLAALLGDAFSVYGCDI